MLQPVLRIDAQADLAALDLAVVERLEKLAPFGRGNPRAVVAVRNVKLLSPPQRMGRAGNTVSFIVGQGAGRMRCVGFGMGKLADELDGVEGIDVAGTPVLNRFAGRSSAEMHLRDVRW